jgi:cleavage and polyadenylation specificity factor subunit 1
VFSRAFNVQKQEEIEKTILAEQKRISHTFVPFVMSSAPGTSLTGVFLTGDRPSWIVATDKGGLRVIPSGHTVVYSFTASSLWESKSEFLIYSDEVCMPYYLL